MPRKKESSDEYEPELSEKSDDQSADEPENAEIPEILTERKAKVNRKNIVESEDSDKLSSDAENSDDYNPYAVKKQTGRIQRHKDSDLTYFALNEHSISHNTLISKCI